jgi:hypothetical protein
MRRPRSVWVAVLFIACGLIPMRSASTQGLKDAEMRRQYQELTEQRFDNDEQSAHDFRDETQHRLDAMERTVAKNSVTLQALQQVADDLHFLKRWVWVPITSLLIILWGAGRKCWKLGWDYGPKAWEWLKHLHECMDLTREAVERNAEEAAKWRVKIDRTLHNQANFLMRMGLSDDENKGDNGASSNS